MKYYKSDFHEKLVRTDAEANQAFAKPMEGGEEISLAPGSPVLIDAINTPITEEEYNEPAEIEEED
jgi:hypothetical protein